MKLLLPLFFVGFLTCAPLFAQEVTPTATESCPKPLTPKAQAHSAAETWLALADAGKWAENWASAAAFFQKNISQEQWTQKAAAVRKLFGTALSRKLKSATYAKSLLGAPDGEYVVLQFDTSFENKKEAIETVTPMREPDGTWKVSGYFIR